MEISRYLMDELPELMMSIFKAEKFFMDENMCSLIYDSLYQEAYMA